MRNKETFCYLYLIIKYKKIFVLSMQNHFKTDKLIHYTQSSIVDAKLRQTSSLFRSMFHKCIYHKS